MIRSTDNKVVDFSWGQLTWYASGELGNSDTRTVGQAVVRPGQQNPRHYHPNCDEVLHVLKGRIPPRELISLRTHDYIVAVLTDGVMRAQAEGLSPAEIQAVARYLK